MVTLRERLAAGTVLVCDGALGTQLQNMGLPPGACPEAWCLERPDAVRGVHQAYRAAGSDIVECNSFGGNRLKLRHYGFQERVFEINRAAAALARDVAGDTQYVLGSIGPTGAFLAPLGDLSAAEAVEVFAEQAEALAAGGADAVVVETMTALDEAAAAVKAVTSRTALVCVVSFTFDPRVDGGYATMMGVDPATAVRAMREAGAAVVGANCGTGPEDMIAVLRAMRRADRTMPLAAMPNAGLPRIEGGRTVFDLSPEDMAAGAARMVAAGAVIVGGCCGTTPAHIRAIKTALSTHAT